MAKPTEEVMERLPRPSQQILLLLIDIFDELQSFVYRLHVALDYLGPVLKITQLLEGGVTSISAHAWSRGSSFAFITLSASLKDPITAAHFAVCRENLAAFSLKICDSRSISDWVNCAGATNASHACSSARPSWSMDS